MPTSNFHENSELKPLYASLKRLRIGEYFYTKDFDYFVLESRLDELWKDCKKEVSSARRIILMGYHNTEDEEQAFMYMMSVWYNMRPDTFDELILPVLENFAEWNPVKINYNLVITRLKELNINQIKLDSFIQTYELIQKDKPAEKAEPKDSNAIQAKSSEAIGKDTVPEAAATSAKIRRVFISHAHKDVKYVEELIDLLKLIGLRKSQIFCTSVRGYGVPLGTNFLAELKERISDEVLVLFVFSPNFFASRICLAELGAAWALSKEHVPIVIPPFGFGEIQGVLPHTQGMVINDGLQINELAEKVVSLFGLSSHLENDDWERSRERIIERIDHSIAQEVAASARVETQAKAKESGDFK